MVGRQVVREETAEQVFMGAFTAAGYTNEQAQNMVAYLDTMLRGRNPTMSSENMANDLTSVSGRWAELAEGGDISARSVSQLTEDDAHQILRGLMLVGPEHEIPVFAEREPAPITTHAYEVIINGETYQVEMNRELEAGSSTTLRASRAGQLYTLLNTDAIIAITAPDGSSFTPADPAYRDFRSLYRDAYAQMDREIERGESSDRIAISTIRRSERT
ncbi:hypothetical protein KKB44_02460 [Candidatus Micrarchaeota archaeon]|nr:hypothetical protein [Candidatus Micrarchaeota archaeon]